MLLILSGKGLVAVESGNFWTFLACCVWSLSLWFYVQVSSVHRLYRCVNFCLKVGSRALLLVKSASPGRFTFTFVLAFLYLIRFPV